MPGSTAGPRSRLMMAGAAALAAILAGCSPSVGQACPAIGWINRIDIRLEGSADDVQRVAWVELCDDRGCSTPVPSPLAQPSLSSPPPVPGTAPPAVPIPPSTPRAASPGQDTDPPYYPAEPDGRAGWTVSVDMATPDTVTVRAFAHDSTVIAVTTTDLTWTRSGGTEACGGPMTTGSVALAVGG